MKKRLAWLTITAGLLGTPQLINDTDANNTSTKNNMFRQEQITKQVNNDILFTIDDGPSRYMVDIAKTLDKHQYRWIFYIVTSWVTETTRKNVIEVLKMWHYVWNHSFSHPNFQTLTIDQAKSQILVSDSLIRDLYEEAGVPREKKYIRYPYGNQPPKYYRQEFNVFLDSLGYENPMFRHQDVDLWDCIGAPKDEDIARMKTGDTILLHERSRTPQTIEKIVQNVHPQDTDKVL